MAVDLKRCRELGVSIALVLRDDLENAGRVAGLVDTLCSEIEYLRSDIKIKADIIFHQECELAEFRASVKCEGETINDNCNDSCCEYNNGECPTVKRG